MGVCTPCLADLPQAVQELGQLLDTLEANQLVVNLRKTPVFLRLTGCKVTGLLKKWTKQIKGNQVSGCTQTAGRQLDPLGESAHLLGRPDQLWPIRNANMEAPHPCRAHHLLPS